MPGLKVELKFVREKISSAAAINSKAIGKCTIMGCVLPRKFHNQNEASGEDAESDNA
jgi:hypothetical protein